MYSGKNGNNSSAAGRGNIIAALGRGLASARGLWLGVALALSAGAAQGQALSGSDAALLQEQMKSLEARQAGLEVGQAKLETRQSKLEAKIDSGHALMRAERRAEHAEMRQEIAEGQVRLIMWIVGLVTGIVGGLNVALVMLVRRYDNPPRAAGRPSRASRAYSAPPEGGFVGAGVKEPKP